VFQLKQVKDIETRLELTGKHDLMDNIQVDLIFSFISFLTRLSPPQMYLLGLPNKLGPLGYLALHHVLEDAEDEEDEEAEVAVEQVLPYNGNISLLLLLLLSPLDPSGACHCQNLPAQQGLHRPCPPPLD
jgi:hypothetical protein